MMLKTRQICYEHGERAGNLLCHQLKQTMAQNAIPEIPVSPDSTSSHPQTINYNLKHIILDYTDHKHLQMRQKLRIF